MGKAKQDIQERHSRGISESEKVVVGEGGGMGRGSSKEVIIMTREGIREDAVVV